MLIMSTITGMITAMDTLMKVDHAIEILTNRVVQFCNDYKAEIEALPDDPEKAQEGLMTLVRDYEI